MYILVVFSLGFSSFNSVFISDMLMPTKCNALAVRNVISVGISPHGIFNSFLFLTFSIISLHSASAQSAVFAKIQRLGRSEPRLEGDSTKNMSQFGLNLAQFGSYVSNRQQ